MIELHRFSFSYSGAKETTLKDINLKIKEGEFVLVVGLSGSGKSTFCRALNGLIPHFYGGSISGHVVIDGMDTRKTKPSKLANTIGMVFQDPENQLVMTNVENEMAFGMENMALPKPEMKHRVDQYAEYFDLKRFFARFIPELSGGEKQKVALASVLAMKPKYIILDEPTSQLDEETAALFLDFLRRLNEEHQVAIILVEHRLERCLKYAKRIIFMNQGRIEVDGESAEVITYLKSHKLIGEFERTMQEKDLSQVIVSAKDITFRYNHAPILRDLNLDVGEQEILSIIGANGSGKSTLLKQLNGLLKPEKGKVTVLGKDVAETTTAKLAKDIGYLGQNPNNYLFEETLEKELLFTLRNLGVDGKEWEPRIQWVLRVLNLERYRFTFPRDLSTGERERAALASIIVAKPKILILDEPTRGLDYWNKMKLASILEVLRQEGMTTIMVTHDYRFVAEHSTRVLALRDGRLEEVPMKDIISNVKEMGSLEA